MKLKESIFTGRKGSRFYFQTKDRKLFRKVEAMTSNRSKKSSTKRRGNGEGSIFQREDGRWTGSISLGYNANGKRKRRTVYGKTKIECQNKLTRLQNQKLEGTVSNMSRQTLATYLHRWLRDSVRPNHKLNTYLAYRSVIKAHLVPYLGSLQISKLSPSHVQNMLSEMERKGVKPGLRSHIHKILRCALYQALKWNLIPRNVCSMVRAPKVETREITPLTAEQARTLLEHAKGDRFEAVYVIALTTGMRQGEILALHWENIDFKSGQLSVRHTLSWEKGEPKLTSPKTKKSKRLIDLPTLAIEALLNHRSRENEYEKDPGSWVFRNRNAKPVKSASSLVKHSFKPLLKKAKLPNIRFHDLRHTAATLMLLEGVHPKVVQERLGHAKISMTLDTYSHVMPTMQKEASDKINRLLSGD